MTNALQQLRLGTYFRVWKMLAITQLQQAFVNRWTNILFLLGKFIRMGMALLFLFIIKNTVQQFAGYTTDQIVIFYLTYQFIDVLGQVFYRGVYSFSDKVRSGEFDFTLTKPLSSLFQSLVGKPDANDAIFIVPTIGLSIWIVSTLDITITAASIASYLILLFNSFLIVTALHILVLVVGVLTTEVDGIVWMYRDLSKMGQFPISVYMQPFRFILSFIIPIGMMITIPAEILVGQRPATAVLLPTCIGIGFFILSLRIWRWCLRGYSSASS